MERVPTTDEVIGAIHAARVGYYQVNGQWPTAAYLGHSQYAAVMRGYRYYETPTSYSQRPMVQGLEIIRVSEENHLRVVG